MCVSLPFIWFIFVVRIRNFDLGVRNFDVGDVCHMRNVMIGAVYRTNNVLFVARIQLTPQIGSVSHFTKLKNQ